MLTPRQRDCLEAIIRLTERDGRSPSYREIARALGTRSVDSAHRMVLLLEDAGWVRRSHRRIEVLRRPPGIPAAERTAVYVVRKPTDGDAVLVPYSVTAETRIGRPDPVSGPARGIADGGGS